MKNWLCFVWLLAGAVLPSVAFAQAADPPSQWPAAAKQDPILVAMIEELTRARNLRLMADPPYFIEIGLDDSENFAVAASLGAIYSPQQSRLRPLRINLRVGSPAFDNTNSVYSEYYPGVRYDSPQLPVENGPLALRNALWLALDRAYKTAAEAIGRKRAALRGVTVSDPQPDFWMPPRIVKVEELRRPKIDEKQWTDRIRNLSAVFSAYPAITGSSVEFDHAASMVYSVNTTSSIVRASDTMAMLRVRASRLAADGSNIYDGFFIAGSGANTLPPEAELKARVEAVAKNIEALASAPKGEAYSGPVLFEPEAAAQIFAEVFGSQLSVPRRIVGEPNRPVPFMASELETRLNLRVLPEGFDVIDDATLKDWKGMPLAGSYAIDYEGVPPKRLSLVEKGILKTFYTSLQPVKGVDGPNGHARLPGRIGVNTTKPGNLIVQASEKKPLAELRAQYIEMLKQQGKQFGYIVRKMDYPSAGSITDLRSLAQRSSRGGGGRTTSQPVLIYKVSVDGSQQLVRGLTFRGLNLRAFRDILAASTEEAVFNYADNGLPLAMMSSGNYFVGCSVVAPAVLFEDLELELGQEDFPKLPLVPPPAVTASAR